MPWDPWAWFSCQSPENKLMPEQSRGGPRRCPSVPSLNDPAVQGRKVQTLPKQHVKGTREVGKVQDNGCPTPGLQERRGLVSLPVKPCGRPIKPLQQIHRLHPAPRSASLKPLLLILFEGTEEKASS